MRNRRNKWKTNNTMSKLRPSINNQFRCKLSKYAESKTEIGGGNLKKHNSTINCLQKTHLKYNSIGGIKVKGWEKTCFENINFKKPKVTTLISN